MHKRDRRMEGRLTDRQTDSGRQQRLRLRIASRGKNILRAAVVELTFPPTKVVDQQQPKVTAGSDTQFRCFPPDLLGIFTRSDRRPDPSARPRLRTTGRENQSGRPVGQTVAVPATLLCQSNRCSL